jgi:hypothetical protein
VLEITKFRRRICTDAEGLLAKSFQRLPQLRPLYQVRLLAVEVQVCITAHFVCFIYSGMSCLELVKVIQDMPLDRYLSTFTNLALPLFTSVTPEEPQWKTTLVKGKEWKWSQWDRVDLFCPTSTLAEVIAQLEEQFGAELTMMSCGVSILYNSFMSKVKRQVHITEILCQLHSNTMLVLWIVSSRSA